jgi:hypothetical protein
MRARNIRADENGQVQRAVSGFGFRLKPAGGGLDVPGRYPVALRDDTSGNLIVVHDAATHVFSERRNLTLEGASAGDVWHLVELDSAAEALHPSAPRPIAWAASQVRSWPTGAPGAGDNLADSVPLAGVEAYSLYFSGSAGTCTLWIQNNAGTWVQVDSFAFNAGDTDTRIATLPGKRLYVQLTAGGLASIDCAGEV